MTHNVSYKNCASWPVWLSAGQSDAAREHRVSIRDRFEHCVYMLLWAVFFLWSAAKKPQFFQFWYCSWWLESAKSPLIHKPRHPNLPKKSATCGWVMILTRSFFSSPRHRPVPVIYNLPTAIRNWWLTTSRIKTVRAGVRDCPQENQLSKRARSFDLWQV